MHHTVPTVGYIIAEETKAGRLLVRSNIAILTIMLAICIMMLVQGVGFECPPERAFNGTVWRNFEANTPARYAPQPGPLA